MASNQRPVRTLALPAENADDSVMTEGSLSTTLPRPETPSGIRRSSRIQNSPKPDYKGHAVRLNTRYDARICILDITLNLFYSFNSKGRSSVSKSLKRSGLEKKDFHNLPNLLNSSGDDELEKDTFTAPSADICSVSFLGKLKKAALDKFEGGSPGLKMMLAALTLVLMLLIAEQCVYYAYLILCYSANSLAGARAVFFSVPEIVSFESQGKQGEFILSDMEKFKSKVESEMDSLKQSIRLIQEGTSDDSSRTGLGGFTGNLDIMEHLIKIKEDLDNQKIEHMKLLRLHDHQIENRIDLEKKLTKLTNEMKYNDPTIETNSEIGKEMEMNTLRAEIDSLKVAIESEDKRLNNSITTEEIFLMVSEKFPVLSTVGEKFDNFEMRTNRLEEKLNSGANISSVMEKYSDSLSQNLFSKIQTQVKSALEEKDRKTETDGFVDWASSTLGAEVAVTPDTKVPLGYSSSGLKLFGLRIWSRKPSPEVIIQRPHSGDCWPFSGTSGTLIFKLSRPVTIQKIAVQQVPSISSPKIISVWDHQR